jgi:protease-4
MTLDADTIVDRRRLRRKLTFWRVLAVLIVILAVLGGGYALYGRRVGVAGGAYIARIQITGLIRNDQDRTEALERLAKSSAKAVIVHIDSPGGTTAGSEQLHNSLRAVAQVKPTVVVVDGLAASGGYIAAMSADHIIASQTSLVGSIGVLFQYPNFSGLMKTVGVQMEEIKSSPLKAAPNGFEPTSPEARDAIAGIVKDSYDWFKNLVATRRHIEGDDLAKVSDGRVFTGRQGLENHLIDQLGDEKTALAWLASDKGIDAKTPVRDWRLKDRFSDLSFLHMAAYAALDAMGLKSWAQRFAGAGGLVNLEKLNLDGLLALWHPPASN